MKTFCRTIFFFQMGTRQVSSGAWPAGLLWNQKHGGSGRPITLWGPEHLVLTSSWVTHRGDHPGAQATHRAREELKFHIMENFPFLLLLFQSRMIPNFEIASNNELPFSVKAPVLTPLLVSSFFHLKIFFYFLKNILPVFPISQPLYVKVLFLPLVLDW